MLAYMTVVFSGIISEDSVHREIKHNNQRGPAPIHPAGPACPLMEANTCDILHLLSMLHKLPMH